MTHTRTCETTDPRRTLAGPSPAVPGASPGGALSGELGGSGCAETSELSHRPGGTETGIELIMVQGGGFGKIHLERSEAQTQQRDEGFTEVGPLNGT